MLITPDWDKPFILQTDAFATGLGYVLSQINADGEEQPIAFGSKKLLPREINYSAIEREVLAIVKGIQHFRTYLEGTSFKIETDHNPLTHLSTLKDSHGRLARWALSLYNPLISELCTGVATPMPIQMVYHETPGVSF